MCACIMDGRNTFPKIKEMLNNSKGKVITIHDLRALIIINIGSNERTIQSCLKIMAETQLIKDIGDCRFEIYN